MGGGGDELCDAAGVGVAERIGVKAAFLPDEAGEKSGVEAVAFAERLNRVAGVIDKMI